MNFPIVLERNTRLRHEIGVAMETCLKAIACNQKLKNKSLSNGMKK